LREYYDFNNSFALGELFFANAELGRDFDKMLVGEDHGSGFVIVANPDQLLLRRLQEKVHDSVLLLVTGAIFKTDLNCGGKFVL